MGNHPQPLSPSFQPSPNLMILSHLVRRPASRNPGGVEGGAALLPVPVPPRSARLRGDVGCDPGLPSTQSSSVVLEPGDTIMNLE